MYLYVSLSMVGLPVTKGKLMTKKRRCVTTPTADSQISFAETAHKPSAGVRLDIPDESCSFDVGEIHRGGWEGGIGI